MIWLRNWNCWHVIAKQNWNRESERAVRSLKKGSTILQNESQHRCPPGNRTPVSSNDKWTQHIFTSPIMSCKRFKQYCLQELIQFTPFVCNLHAYYVVHSPPQWPDLARLFECFICVPIIQMCWILIDSRETPSIISRCNHFILTKTSDHKCNKSRWR